jgi:hypothetical protein
MLRIAEIVVKVTTSKEGLVTAEVVATAEAVEVVVTAEAEVAAATAAVAVVVAAIAEAVAAVEDVNQKQQTLIFKL